MKIITRLIFFIALPSLLQANDVFQMELESCYVMTLPTKFVFKEVSQWPTPSSDATLPLTPDNGEATEESGTAWQSYELRYFYKEIKRILIIAHSGTGPALTKEVFQTIWRHQQINVGQLIEFEEQKNQATTLINGLIDEYELRLCRRPMLEVPMG